MLGPAAVAGTSTFDHDVAFVVKPFFGTRLGALRSSGFERGAGRDLAVLQVAPQRDRQAPCQGHDAYAPHALAACGEAPVEPLGQLAVGLQAQPAPRELHQQRPRSLVAGLADALLDLAATTVVGRGRQSQAAGQLAPVGEAPPAEQLLDQHPGAFGPNCSQLGQLRYQRLLAVLHRFALLAAP